MSVFDREREVIQFVKKYVDEMINEVYDCQTHMVNKDKLTNLKAYIRNKFFTKYGNNCISRPKLIGIICKVISDYIEKGNANDYIESKVNPVNDGLVDDGHLYPKGTIIDGNIKIMVRDDVRIFINGDKRIVVDNKNILVLIHFVNIINNIYNMLNEYFNFSGDDVAVNRVNEKLFDKFKYFVNI